MLYVLDTIIDQKTENVDCESIVSKLASAGALQKNQDLNLKLEKVETGSTKVAVCFYEARLGYIPKDEEQIISSLIGFGLNQHVAISSITGGNGVPISIYIHVELYDSTEVQNKAKASQVDNTVINSAVVDEHQTIINDMTESQATQLNGQIIDSMEKANSDNAVTIVPGTILCEVYEVIERLNVTAGEASLYICEFAARQYIAKVYNRKVAVKASVVEQLSQIRSRYVARLFAVGEFQGYPVEILPYYSYGSLSGKTFSFDQLKYEIIPSVNEGLHVLHEHGIIHKDIKPSNIMLNNDGRTAAIIDFGISSIRDQGNTVLVTKTGLTPEYSAPETFRNLFLFESDYYSFGITIYELFCGHSPYSDLSQEEIEQFLSIQKLPLPNDMNQELKDLINALTYPDITNRKDKSNPNRRWCYEEVIDWCNDVPRPIPGEIIHDRENIFKRVNDPILNMSKSTSQSDNGSMATMEPYQFGGKSITTRKDMAKALNELWEEGKKHLFRGLLLSHFKKSDDAELISHLMDFEEESETEDPDFLLFKCIYSIDPKEKALLWKGNAFSSLNELGNNYLNAIRENDSSFLNLMDELLSKGVLSEYIRIIDSNALEHIEVLLSLESRHRLLNNGEQYQIDYQYSVAYLLADTKDYVVNNIRFLSIEDLSACIVNEYNSSDTSYDTICRKYLFDIDGAISIQYKCWISAIGRTGEYEIESGNDNQILFRSMYLLNPGFKKLSWNGTEYDNLQSFGQAYLDALRSNNEGMIKIVEELRSHHLISNYLKYTDLATNDKIEAINTFETMDLSQLTESELIREQYRFAYFLSESNCLVINDVSYSNVEDLTNSLHKTFSESHEDFNDFCKLLLSDGKLDPQFECWLEAIGLSGAIASWKQSAI